MTVTVLYFGRIAEQLGTAQETVEVSTGVDVRSLIEILRKKHASLNAFPDEYFRVARNAKYAEPSEKISDGDTIALIPPVSGG